MRYSDWEQRQMDIKSGEELDRHAERKARKEWCENMAKLEDGQEIGAGSPDHPLRGGSVRDYLEQRERDLEAALSRERDANSELLTALKFLDAYLRTAGTHGDARTSIRKLPVVRALLDE